MSGKACKSIWNPQVVAWVLYDFSNSAYILLVPAVAFAVYYRQVVAGGHAGADLQWSFLVSLSLAIAGFLAPFIGSLADVGGLRHRLFTLCTVICCLLTGLLWFITDGMVVVGGILFIVANVTYAIAISLYDSYLRSIVDNSRSARLSSIGWGVGYLGGILCFILCYPLLKGGLATDNLVQYRTSFTITAGFYLVFSIPAFIMLRGIVPRENSRSQFSPSIVMKAYAEVIKTVRQWRAHKEIFKFLLAFYFISDAIVTVIYFTAIFLQTNFGMPVTEILILTLIVQLIGIPCTIIAGVLGDRIGKKIVVLATLVVWVGVVLLMVFGRHPVVPYLMAGTMGLVLGSTQAVLRSMFSDMLTENHAAEFFGFNALAGKVSSVLGPLTFGLIATATGSQRLGLASLLLFFGTGAVILTTVKPSRSAKHVSKW
ncbi:D-galactonate transporter [Anaerohalosphaera lusitana]|uniref:D-galactonate transporter n=1 Tax=Anaerohalosphaera lusitana TaxID=1936003 RepID=A0A1U9NJC7_9BACT|nr:MFS transporter [Anaerohalosphaera lusitana]AQT67907.1 D-galactonate transporter [Anaerohalosphaera lusitana]